MGRPSLLQTLRVFLGGWRHERARTWAHRSASAFQLESLESRILLAADLTGVIQSAVLPNPALEGSIGSAIVQVVNQGNQASNRMEVGVYISQDSTLDASDILIATASSGSGVSVGKPKGFTVPFTISTQLDPGTYRLLAKVDNANATVENNETNNVAVGGTLNVAWQFGSVPGKTGQTPLTLRDADSTVATFSLTGPGTGEVVKNGAFWDVRLTGTDATTALTITTNTGGNGRLTLNKIDVAGSLASFTATTTDLLGALTVNGPLPVVKAGSIANGIVSANAAPVAVADMASVTEGGTVTIDVFANDTDANADDTKTIVGVNSEGLLGTVSAPDGAPNGTLVYSVGEAFNSLKAGAIATENFSYTMRDTAGATSTASVTVTITGTNDGPEPVADSAFAQEHQAILINVLANDTDPDAGDTLRIQSIGPGTFGTTNFASSGGVPMIYYTPTLALRAGEQKDDQFSYTVVDSAGAQSTATVTVTITGVNDAPVAIGDRVTVSEDTGAITVNVLTNDTDPDAGDEKTVTAVDGNGRPSQIVITSADTSTFTTFIVIPAIPAIRGAVSVAPDGQGVVYTPTQALQALRAGQVLTETIFYTMRDAAGLTSSSSLVVTVTGVNDPLKAVADQVTIGKNAAPVSINILANDMDLDAGDTKTVVAFDTAGLQGKVALAPGGASLIYTVRGEFLNLPTGEKATETFSYTIQDSAGAQSTATVTVEIVSDNTAPEAVADEATATENGVPVTINVLTNDFDPDAGENKSVVSLANTTGLKGTVAIAPGGTGIIYTVGQAFQQLRAGATATEQFTYTVADALGAQSTTTVTVTVTGVNDVPVLGGNATVSVAENQTAVGTFAAVDPDAGDTVTYSLSGANAGLFTINEAGVVSFLAAPNFEGAPGPFNITVTATDAGSLLDTQNVTVNVTNVNEAPVANVDTLTVTEDANNVTLAVLANDTDADAGDTKTIVSVDGTRLSGTVRTVTSATGGVSIQYSAGAAFQSLIAGQTALLPETFTYTMRDRAGAQSIGTVNLTVTGVTDGPKAVADTVGSTVVPVAEDGGSILINVLANDTNDVNPSDLAIASIDVNGQFGGYFVTGSATGNTQYGFAPGFPRLLGKASVAADGQSILYTPLESLNQDEVGIDTFRYTLVGGSTGVVTITVTGANDRPEALGDTATVAADGVPITIDVLANDTDPDTRIDPPLPPSPTGDLLDIVVDATPVDIPDTKKVVSVDVDLDDDGISDLQGSVVIASDGGSVTYTAGGSLLNLAFGLTATETFTYTMQDSLEVQSTATVRVTVTGTNQAPVAETDSATATEQDSLDVQSIATVTVTVAGTNQAPVAEADSATATENDAPVTIDVLANDSDVDSSAGDSFSIVGINTTGLQGTASIQGGIIVYTVGNVFQSLKAGAPATETFSYTIQDNKGAQSTGTVTVTVVGANDGPVAVNDGLTISEDDLALTFNVLANDTDLDDGDTKTIVSLDTTGLQGAATIAADGSGVIYTVGQAFQYLESGVASDTFTYTMRDSSGALSTARVTVTVIGAPEAPPAGSIMGTTGDDIITTANTNDTIYGQAGDDDISSGGGADTIFGGAGRDTIDGGDGNDVLVGGGARDNLTGGAGADTFQYVLVSDSNSLTLDRIEDFEKGEGDKIDLSQIDANTTLAGNQAFVVSAGFTGVAGQLVLTQDAGGNYLVNGDVNGDGIVDFQIEVRTSDTLSAGDFKL